jgi:two-component system, OmpR family, phosphate regulon sensor histidine kinase PhoR
MKRKNLRQLILFGSFVLSGLLIVQGYWLKRAFDIEERQFNHAVQMAMKHVADSIVADRPDTETGDIHVRQLSGKFFFAELNAAVDPEVLGLLIQKELAIRRIRADYELGIYRADDDTLVYGQYIPATIQWQIDQAVPHTPMDGEKRNFTIFFPNKFSVIAGEIHIWIFSTVVLLLMTAFFVYAMLSLLKERRLAEIKEDFINNLTHEFKTPIANIELASEALKTNRIPDGKQEQYFNIIYDENKRLKTQVERILQLAAFDHKALNLDLKIVNVHHLLQRLTTSIGMRMKETAGVLNIDLSASNPNILADEFHLANTVYNLLDNAAKFCKDHPEISISTRNEKEGLLISIRDAGIGIGKEFQKQVFDRFFRVPTGDVHNVKGFGLGLSYVRTIVEAHRGSISLHSEPNHGSRFDIYLPTE